MTVKLNNTTINIEEVFGNLRKRREEGIAKVRKAQPSLDRFAATIAYDYEHAPLTTNAAMLRMIGIDPTTTVSDDEAAARVRSIIDGLAAWSIYLCGTNHLTDSAMLKVLARILADEVRLVPPDGVRSEFLDLAIFEHISPDTVEVCNRDSGLPRPPR